MIGGKPSGNHVQRVPFNLKISRELNVQTKTPVDYDSPNICCSKGSVR